MSDSLKPSARFAGMSLVLGTGRWPPPVARQLVSDPRRAVDSDLVLPSLAVTCPRRPALKHDMKGVQR